MQYLDTSLVHLDCLLSLKHLGQVEVLVAMTTGIQLNGPLYELLCLLLLAQLNQQVRVLVHYQSVIRESTSSFVQKTHCLFKLQIVDTLFSFLDEL